MNIIIHDPQSEAWIKINEKAVYPEKGNCKDVGSIDN